MAFRPIHRWLGLIVGALALVAGITGTVLAIDPLVSAWQASPAPAELPVSTLVERVAANIPGAEEIRRLPSGDIVVFSFDSNQARADHIDPASGQAVGDYHPSALMRWFRNLHRSFLLGDAGRITAAGVALAMLLLAISGLVLLQRRQGGWRRVFGRARGTLLQRLHVIAGQMLVALLGLSSITALIMSAYTFNWLSAEAAAEPGWCPLSSPTPWPRRPPS